VVARQAGLPGEHNDYTGSESRDRRFGILSLLQSASLEGIETIEQVLANAPGHVFDT